MAGRLKGSATVALLLSATWATEARADPYQPSDEARAAARPLGTEGVEAALRGDCRTAVDKLTRAEALVHAPTTAVPLAQCWIQLGKIITGTEMLNRVLNETLPPNAPPSWVEAKARAQALLDAATPRIAKLRIHLERPPGAPEGAQVSVDGEAVPAVLIDQDRPTDPGPHHVVAVQPGFLTAEADVTLSDGQSQAVTLRLEPAPLAAATGPAPLQPAGSPPAGNEAAPPAAPAPAGSAVNRTPAYVTWTVAGAGLAVGAVFGVLALSAKSKLDGSGECAAGPKFCGASAASDIDALQTDAVISTIGWGVAGAGAVLGTILFFTAGSSAPQTTGAAGWRPWIGAGSAGVIGSFQ